MHARLELPELVQGLLVAGATGLAIVPLYVAYFGMTFEIAVALCIIQGFIIALSPIAFGDPFCAGWLTPALPLVLRQATSMAEVSDRIDFVTALVLSVAVVFLFFGLTGLGPLFLRRVPRALQAGIILGAGMSAIYGEFTPSGADNLSRLDRYPVCIMLAVGVTLLLLFSLPVERLKRRFRSLAALAALGIAPGFVVAMIVGPWVGEVDYSSVQALFVDPESGAWIFGLGDVFFWPQFGALLEGYSPLSRGFPSLDTFILALPLTLVAYVIGFGDLVTGSAILKEAQKFRPDEKIPLDDRRTHLSLGLRNALQALLTGPFFPLHGPLWTGSMVVVAERFRRGRKQMDSIFGGIFSYYAFGIPILLFCRPVIELLRPVLNIAFSLTLLLTGFACAYVALAMVKERTERGVVVLVGMLIMYPPFFRESQFSIGLGLLAGLAITIALLGRDAFRREEAESPR